MRSIHSSAAALAALVWALIISAPATAQSTEAAPAPTALLGEWRAVCNAWGTEAQCELDWSEGLHTDHMTVRYAILNAESGAVIFRGTGVYRVSESSIEGYWSDSGGAIHPLRAVWADSALTTHWGTAGATQGRTRYQLHEDGSLQVTDWELSESGWRQFMDVTYQRSSGE